MNSPCIRPDWLLPDGVIALTTLRTGGCSIAPYASFNLADHVGDDPEAVRANRALLADQLPPDTHVRWLQQVHGTRVIRADGEEEPGPADASWTQLPGVACAVMTADCLPVLFCSRAGDRVAAAHAGWRGLLAGVLEQTVAAMTVDGSDLLAWLGPGIGPGAFEVGGEVRAAFLEAAGEGARGVTDACFSAHPRNAGHYFADLYGLARLRLQALGVRAVSGGGDCTFTRQDRYFSYRRDGATGRMASLILLDPGQAPRRILT